MMRLADRDDHEQAVALRQVRRVQVPGRVPPGDHGGDEVGEDRYQPDPRPDGRIDESADEDERQADATRARPSGRRPSDPPSRSSSTMDLES